MFSSFFDDQTDPLGINEDIPIKIVVLGAKNVGKTTIGNALSHFTEFDNNHTFGSSGRSHTPQYKSTFVADVFNKKMKISTLIDAIRPNEKAQNVCICLKGNIDLSISFWDTAGYELHDDLPPSMLLNGAAVVLLCFSFDEPSSVDKLKPLLEHCQRSNVSDHCVYFALGHKMDVFRNLCGLMIKMSTRYNNSNVISDEEQRKSKGKNDHQRWSTRNDYVFTYDPFERFNTDSVFKSFSTHIEYADVKKTFFDTTESSLEEFRTLLDKLNASSVRDPINSSTPTITRSLISFTTCFCNNRSIFNPVYCLLYATAIYLRKSLCNNECHHRHKGSKVNTTTTIKEDPKHVKKRTSITTTTRERETNSTIKLGSSHNNIGENTHMLKSNDVKNDDCCT